MSQDELLKRSLLFHSNNSFCNEGFHCGFGEKKVVMVRKEGKGGFMVVKRDMVFTRKKGVCGGLEGRRMDY